MAAQASSQLRTLAFYGTGAIGLGTGAYIFHTLTDFSQAIVQRENRNEFMQSYNNRHRNAAIGMSGILANTASEFFDFAHRPDRVVINSPFYFFHICFSL